MWKTDALMMKEKFKIDSITFDQMHIFVQVLNCSVLVLSIDAIPFNVTSFRSKRVLGHRDSLCLFVILNSELIYIQLDWCNRNDRSNSILNKVYYFNGFCHWKLANRSDFPFKCKFFLSLFDSFACAFD